MLLNDYTFVVCGSGHIETLNHLFLSCNFAAQCWASLNLVSNVDLDPFIILENFKADLQVPFFMEIIILMCLFGWLGMP